MSTMTTAQHTTIDNLDEHNRQVQQADMIRQYVNLANIDSNSLSMMNKLLNVDSMLTSMRTESKRLR
jgi:hypothetical protein